MSYMAKRIRIYKAGGFDQLKIEDFHCPEPTDKEIKINVKSAGINFADTIVRQGHYASAKKYIGWPITPGFEVAGTVMSVGKKVDSFKVGDRVMAITLFNGYSSEIVVRAANARKIPKVLSFDEAAGILAVFGTSYYANYWLNQPRRGSVCLVHSAAGGVGLALVQMLKDLDCTVIGVVGNSSKVAVTKTYGADEVIDKSSQDLWKTVEKIAPEGFDIVFDPNGASTFKQSYKHLKMTGKLIIYGHQSMLSKTKGKQNPLLLVIKYLQTPRFNAFNMVTDSKSVLGFNVSFFFDQQDMLTEFLNYIVAKIENKKLRPLPVKTYSYTNIAQAHQDLQSGKTTGKLVINF